MTPELGTDTTGACDFEISQTSSKLPAFPRTKQNALLLFLVPTAVSGITCCYGYLVTMATEADTYNIAVGRYKNFIFSASIP